MAPEAPRSMGAMIDAFIMRHHAGKPPMPALSKINRAAGPQPHSSGVAGNTRLSR